MALRTEVRDSQIVEEGRGRKVYRCEVVVLDGEEVIHRRHYARHLSHASIDQEYLQKRVDDVKEEAIREAKNTTRIDPESIS